MIMGEGRGWDRYRSNELVLIKDGICLGLIPRQAMKVLHFDDPISLRARHLNGCIQRNERDVHVTWIHSYAMRCSTKDGMHTVETIQRTTACTRFTLIAWCCGIIEVRASGTLHEVSTYSCHVTELCRRTSIQG